MNRLSPCRAVVATTALVASAVALIAPGGAHASPWVCLAPCNVTGCPTGQVCRTDGTCAAPSLGTHYGPFSVKSDAWYPSGASVKTGDLVTVEAGGYFVATTDGTHIGPGGGGYWGWWELVAQIGTWRTYAPGGSFVAGADGALEFGVPRAIQSTYFVPDDIALLSGALTVEVWVKSP